MSRLCVGSLKQFVSWVQRLMKTCRPTSLQVMNLFKTNRIADSFSNQSNYGSRLEKNSTLSKGKLTVITDEDTGLSRFITIDSSVMGAASQRKKISNACKALKLKFNKKSEKTDYVQSTWNCCAKSQEKDIYVVYQYTSFPPFKSHDQLNLKNYSHLS